MFKRKGGKVYEIFRLQSLGDVGNGRLAPQGGGVRGGKFGGFGKKKGKGGGGYP